MRAGHQVLGVIFVLCDRPGLVEDADRVLMDAARTTALHLLRTRDPLNPGRARQGEVLRGLLSGAAVSAAVLGVPPGTSLAVATVRPAAPSPDGEPAEVLTVRLLDLVALYGEYWHPASACLLEPGSITLALPVLAGSDADPERVVERLRKLGTDLVRAAGRSGGVALSVAVGPVVPLAEAARSRRLAVQVADVLVGRGQAVAVLDDVRSAVVLAALREGRASDDEALLLPPVKAVLDYDRAQGTDYAMTMLTHLGCGGDMAETARRLRVHENTARYRVRRASERFGLQLADGDETLVAWLQIRGAVGPPPP